MSRGIAKRAIDQSRLRDCDFNGTMLQRGVFNETAQRFNVWKDLMKKNGKKAGKRSIEKDIRVGICRKEKKKKKITSRNLIREMSLVYMYVCVFVFVSLSFLSFLFFLFFFLNFFTPRVFAICRRGWMSESRDIEFSFRVVQHERIKASYISLDCECFPLFFFASPSIAMFCSILQSARQALRNFPAHLRVHAGAYTSK